VLVASSETVGSDAEAHMFSSTRDSISMENGTASVDAAVARAYFLCEAGWRSASGLKLQVILLFV
jgi:hypothetical protein